MSIRARLSVAIALVLVATLTLLGVVLVRTTRATLVDQIDDQVREIATRAKGKPNTPPHRPPGDGMRDPAVLPKTVDPPEPAVNIDQYLRRQVARFVYEPTGVLHEAEPSGFRDDPDPRPRLPPIPSAEVDALIAAGRIVTAPAIDGSHSYRLLVEREPDGEIAVTAAPLATVDVAVSRLVRVVLVVGLVALAAATLASWWLIRRGLRPVDRMVDTAAAIAAGDLTRRVPDANSRSELGRLGAALNEMLGQIERALRVREASEERLRRFVADAAHELRTPLTSLRGYAELYRQGALTTPEMIAGAMGRIEGESARMTRLVDDLLLLARLDRQRGLEREPVDVVALVREAAADFRVVAPDRPLSLHLEGEAMVRGDRVRLRQIVDNLLANARTHTPPQTPVHLAVRRHGHKVEVVVADEGPGIPAEAQPKVFERFWRADPGRSRSRGGTGLGLAIVASLAQAHDGTVELASEPGRGATFTVLLPLAEPPFAPADRPPAAAPTTAEPAAIASGTPPRSLPPSPYGTGRPPAPVPSGHGRGPGSRDASTGFHHAVADRRPGAAWAKRSKSAPQDRSRRRLLATRGQARPGPRAGHGRDGRRQGGPDERAEADVGGGPRAAAQRFPH